MDTNECRTLLLLVGTLTGLAYAAKKVYNAKDIDAFNVAFAISVATTLLVSFHSFLNDFSLMILPLLIYAPAVANSESLGKKKAYWMVTLGFLFFFTPLYLLLLSEKSLGWFFLVELSALWLASHWRTADRRGGPEQDGDRGSNFLGSYVKIPRKTDFIATDFDGPL